MRIIDALLSSPGGPHPSESADRRDSASAQPAAPYAPRSAVIKRDSMKATRIITISTSNEPSDGYSAHHRGYRAYCYRGEEDAYRREYTKQCGSEYNVTALHNQLLPPCCYRMLIEGQRELAVAEMPLNNSE